MPLNFVCNFKKLSILLSTIVLGITTVVAVKAANLMDIEKKGYMVVVTEDDYAPFNFMTDGQADGFNKDVLIELKKYAKFDVQQKFLPWTGLLASISSGQYDMGLTGAVISDNRLRALSFAAPYASAQSFYVKRKDNKEIDSIASLSNKTFGIQAGSAMVAKLPELKKLLEKSGGKLGRMVQYPSYPEAYADLANGRLDYVIDSEVPINNLVKKQSDVFAKGQAVSGPGFVAWPVAKNNTELLTYLTGFMKHLKETGKLAELQEKWFGRSFDLPLESIDSVQTYHRLINQ